MKHRKRNISAEERESTKKVNERIRAWRTFPDDPWAELEHLGLTEEIGRLGWSQPRVTRAMNSVASAERFRLKVHRALQSEGDQPLWMGVGVGRPGTPEGDHGYTHNPSQALDPHADVIDLSTREKIDKESAEKRGKRIERLILAMEDVRTALDERVQANPELVAVVGRELWQIRGRIDAAKQRLEQRRAA